MRTGHPGRMRDPSPEEIAEACRQIRASWTPEEKLRRAGIVEMPVELNPVTDGKRRWCAGRFSI